MSAMIEPRRILLLVTTGGFTHAAPVLEIGAILSSRGHEVHFATLAGQESWTKDYPYIEATHIVGPAVPEDDLDAHYERMRVWSPQGSIAPVIESRMLFDSFWPTTYRALKKLCEDPSTKPDFIVADFFAEAAARDMLRQFNIQLASVWPMMPPLMAPASYIPGQAGFQTDITVTSEHASFMSRLRNEMVMVWALPVLTHWIMWTKRMRAEEGVHYPLVPQTKPDYLVLVNSFFGLEAPKELPPLMHAVGPILGDTYPDLDEDLSEFLPKYDRVIYVSLGTHVCLPLPELEKLLFGLKQAIDAGSIDAVIWSLSEKARANFDLGKTYTFSEGNAISTAALLSNTHPRFRLPTFAPQRAILAHPSLKLFLTHGGSSSANEALFHGVPVLTIGYFFDQLGNSVRLRQAGVGLSLDKFTFTSAGIAEAINKIVTDADGDFARNVLRMQRISKLACRRKHYASSLIEEVMYDQELRFKDGVEKRPMHLQTADVRMSFWRARNWDIRLLGFSSLAVTIVAGWWMARDGWRMLPRLVRKATALASGFVGVMMEKRLNGWR